MKTCDNCCFFNVCDKRKPGDPVCSDFTDKALEICGNCRNHTMPNGWCRRVRVRRSPYFNCSAFTPKEDICDV